MCDTGTPWPHVTLVTHLGSTAWHTCHTCHMCDTGKPWHICCTCQIGHMKDTGTPLHTCHTCHACDTGQSVANNVSDERIQIQILIAKDILYKYNYELYS